jgi:hypothetical protein
MMPRPYSSIWSTLAATSAIVGPSRENAIDGRLIHEETCHRDPFAAPVRAHTTYEGKPVDDAGFTNLAHTTLRVAPANPFLKITGMIAKL